MGFVAAVLLFSFAFAAIVEGDYPQRPKIPETFSTWFTNVEILEQNTSTIIVSQNEGYFARDMVGGRELINGSVQYSTTMYVYSLLSLVKQNVTYRTTWYEDGNRTCYMYSGAEILPMWEWIENASYIGRAYNEDVWEVDYDEYNESRFIDVPTNNPTIPLDVGFYDGNSDVGTRTIYKGFDPMYQPADSDFEIPYDCESFGKDHSSHNRHIFNRRKQRKMAPTHGKKNFQSTLKKRIFKKKMML